MPLHLDPRCKLYLLLLSNFMLFFHVSAAAEAVMMALFLILYFMSGQWRRGLRMSLTYAVLLCASQIVPAADGLAINWVLALCVTARMMWPCITTGAYAFTTTGVGEFVCALRRSKVPESIVIPCMVVIRFFPTIREDYRQIRASMALRGIVGGGAGMLMHPLQALEYILIPLLMNSNNVAQDLSVAALTKGIGLPGEHTSMIEIHFGAADALVCIACTIPLLLSIGGAL